MTDPQPTGAAQAIVDFLEHSRQHFGLPEQRRPGSARRLGYLLVAGALGGLAGSVYANETQLPPARHEQPAPGESRTDNPMMELKA